MAKAISKAIQMSLFIGLIITQFNSTAGAQNWNQLGNPIQGASLDKLGYAVDLSNEGNLMVVGSPTHTKIVNGSFEYEKGNVKTYVRVGNGWNKIGATIEGENNYDQLGTSVSVDENGTTMAIGVPLNDDNGEDAGYVKIYQRAGVNWTPKGGSILGGNTEDQFGTTVNISSDGNTVAIGAPNNDDNGMDAGQIKLYEWDGTAWVQKGNPINGIMAGDHAGKSIALNNDGTTISIGVPFNNISVNNAGYVATYDWDGSDWALKGGILNGSNNGDHFGHAVSISEDGNLLAISAPNNSDNYWKSGQVQTYAWNGSNWVQTGSNLDGIVFEDRFGQSLSLSSDGQSLAIGAPLKHVSGTGNGQVLIYDWSGSQWIQRVGALSGDVNFEKFGGAISLSDDRRVIAIGAPDNNENNTLSGKLSVYQWDMILGVDDQIAQASINIFPNPSTGYLSLEMDEKLGDFNVEVFNAMGQSVLPVQEFKNGTASIDLTQVDNGFYIVNIWSKTFNVSRKVMVRR